MRCKVLQNALKLFHTRQRALHTVNNRAGRSEVVQGRVEVGVPIPGKGLGVVAARELAPGDVVLFDTAFVRAEAEHA